MFAVLSPPFFAACLPLRRQYWASCGGIPAMGLTWLPFKHLLLSLLQARLVFMAAEESQCFSDVFNK